MLALSFNINYNWWISTYIDYGNKPNKFVVILMKQFYEQYICLDIETLNGNKVQKLRKMKHRDITKKTTAWTQRGSIDLIKKKIKIIGTAFYCLSVVISSLQRSSSPKPSLTYFKHVSHLYIMWVLLTESV